MLKKWTAQAYKDCVGWMQRKRITDAHVLEYEQEAHLRHRLMCRE